MITRPLPSPPCAVPLGTPNLQPFHSPLWVLRRCWRGAPQVQMHDIGPKENVTNRNHKNYWSSSIRNVTAYTVFLRIFDLSTHHGTIEIRIFVITSWKIRLSLELPNLHVKRFRRSSKINLSFIIKPVVLSDFPSQMVGNEHWTSALARVIASFISKLRHCNLV